MTIITALLAGLKLILTDPIATIRFINSLVSLVNFITGKIDEATFHAEISKINADATKAQTGDVPSRLSGGTSVQDDFNKRT